MPLTLNQVKDVCLINDAADCCRFLADDDVGNFYCLKMHPRRNAIDKEVMEFKKKQNKVGIDPESLDKPIGDNCIGYTFLKYKKQGYDI